MFTRVKGKTVVRHLQVTVSTVFAEKSLVSWSSGALIAATSSTTAASHAGVLIKAIAATDSDYADARLVAVEVPVEKDVVWEVDVTSGLVAADKGLFVDLTDSETVDRSASTIDALQCVKVLSTTKGHFIINNEATKA